MGILGFVIGSVAGQFCGAAVYLRVSSDPSRKLQASIAGGVAAAVCSSAIYVAFGVQDWLAGPDSWWGVSVFMGICMGLCQAVLFKGRPLGAFRTH